MAVKRKYRLNLRNYGNLPAIMLSQYDEGYALEFEIRDGTEAASDLSAYTVTLKGTRADTLAYSFSGTISTNVLTFVIDTTMTACAGRGTAEIAIKDTANDVLFATFNMPVFVERAAVPEGSIDADVERAQEIAEQIQEIVNTAAAEVKGEAESWAVGQRDGTDVPATDPTYHNNAKYYSEQARQAADSIGIDATLTQAGKAADAKATGDEIGELKSGFTQMTTATASDVGKALKVKTVTDGKVTEWEFGDAGGSEGLDDLENAVFDVGNYLDVSQWKSTTNSTVVNNNDGTFTFQTGDYGTTIWESLGEVPVGTYTLLGLPKGFSVISPGTSYSSGYIAKNDTEADIEYVNPTAQKLYLIVRLNSAPSEEFTISPTISYKKLALVENDQGVANAGKALIVGADGIVEPADIQIDVDNTLTQEGAAADAKAVGTAINALATFKKISVTKVLEVSGDLDSSVTKIIGFIIPQGRVAKVTISTDIPYRGDKFEVRHVDDALYTLINDVWSGQQYYDEPVTYEASYADAFMIALRITLRHIGATSGTLTVKIEYDDGVDLSSMDNQTPNKAGANLINPAYVFDHAGLDPTVDYISRFTSNISIGYVPIKAGGTVTFNKSVSRCVIVDGLYDGMYDPASIVSDATKITNSAETDKYVICHTDTSAFADLIAVDGEYGADYKPYNPIGGYTEETPDNSYGTIGRYYPDEVKNLKRMDGTQRANRLRFLHVTDTHQSGNTPLYYTDEFADLSGANFMTITGDLVNSTIENDFTKTAEAINAMTKPCYICMGNHDVWNDTAETQRYTKYFNPIATHNGLAQNVSYYAVDYSTEKVKCIWLDQYELSTGTPANIMSATQINWLFGQLDDAITNNMHVCIFMHTALASVEKPENPFFDHTPLNSKATGIGWILDVISAFQTGSSVTFEHNSNSYSHTFSGNGVFVSYFCGHTHWDACGWYKDYNQFACVCTRLATVGEGYDNTYRGDKLKIACNYVCIDTAQRRLSVIRVGQNTTIAGIKREAFSVEY